MPDFPYGAIVETNCVFSNDCIVPVTASPLPEGPKSLVMRNLLNNEDLFYGIKERNLNRIFGSFMNQPLCSLLTLDDGKKLFKKMIENTQDYLPDELKNFNYL